MMTMKKWKISLLLFTVLLVIVGFFSPEYIIDLIAISIIYGLFAASVDLSYGYTGILNLGSALYFGIGAYIMAFGLKADMNYFVTVILSLLFSIIISSVIGYVGFRVKASQIHFGLIGLAITLGFEQLIISLYDITGGSNGITGVSRPTLSLFGLEISLQSTISYYIFVVFIVMVVLFLLWRIVNSDFGKLIKALRHDEVKVESMGFSPIKVKMTVNMITATISTLAGVLFVPISGIAYPSLFGVALSMSVLIWVALGGTGTLLGPFLLAAFLKLSESTLSSSFEETYMLIIGLVFVIMVIVAPAGVTGLLKRFTKNLEMGKPKGTNSMKEGKEA
jgi:urea transport system permease protein